MMTSFEKTSTEECDYTRTMRNGLYEIVKVNRFIRDRIEEHQTSQKAVSFLLIKRIDDQFS